MENEKIDLYSIVCKYNPEEARLNASSDPYDKNNRNNQYIHNYENTLNIFGIKPEYQKKLRNGQNLVFTQDPSIENTVALFCLCEKDYSRQIEFNNYTVEFIRENMSHIRKREFLNTNIDFLFDLYNKLLELIKSINSDEYLISKIIDTVNITVRISAFKLNDLKKYINNSLLYDNIFISDKGILSEIDKIKFLKLIKTCMEDVFNLAYHVQDYMSGIRLSELDNAFEFNTEYNDDNLNISLLHNVIVPDRNIISKLPDEEKELIINIFDENNTEYLQRCEGKKENSRKNYFKDIKQKIREQLTEQKIDTQIIEELVNNIQYKDLPSRSCNEQRYLWQKTDSNKLIEDAISDYINTICTAKSLFDEQNDNEDDSFENKHDTCIDLYNLLRKYKSHANLK